MTTSLIHQALALGAAVLALSIGGALAATTDSSVNVMSGPGAHFRTVATLPANDDITLGKKSGSWCDISGPAKGWVPCADVSGATATKTAVTNPVPSSGWNGYEYGTDRTLGTGFGGLNQSAGAEAAL